MFCVITQHFREHQKASVEMQIIVFCLGQIRDEKTKQKYPLARRHIFLKLRDQWEGALPLEARNLQIVTEDMGVDDLAQRGSRRGKYGIESSPADLHCEKEQIFKEICNIMAVENEENLKSVVLKQIEPIKKECFTKKKKKPMSE